jgi:putative tryptophan/tyrosine transport system substrate-binding protein
MRRRQFITLLGGAAATWPLAARAQQPLPVIGWLNPGSAKGHAAESMAFKRGLEDAGYSEGRNVAIEYRWAGGDYDRLPALAADLVDRKVTVIVATGGDSPLAARALNTTIPIVFSTGADPVARGLVASLAHPGGNATGATIISVELAPKRLELLHQVLPGTTTTAALINPATGITGSQTTDLQRAARTLGLQLEILHAGSDQEIESAFEAMVRLRVGGLVIGTDAFFTDRSQQIAALSLRYAVPTVYQDDFAAAGGLMSYGASLTDAFRLVGVYTGRILRGEKPADLPVQQSTKVELVINLKTARALGLSVPLELLGRADEVIE